MTEVNNTTNEVWKIAKNVVPAYTPQAMVNDHSTSMTELPFTEIRLLEVKIPVMTIPVQKGCSYLPPKWQIMD